LPSGERHFKNWGKKDIRPACCLSSPFMVWVKRKTWEKAKTGGNQERERQRSAPVSVLVIGLMVRGEEKRGGYQERKKRKWLAISVADTPPRGFIFRSTRGERPNAMHRLPHSQKGHDVGRSNVRKTRAYPRNSKTIRRLTRGDPKQEKNGKRESNNAVGGGGGGTEKKKKPSTATA